MARKTCIQCGQVIPRDFVRPPTAKQAFLLKLLSKLKHPTRPSHFVERYVAKFFPVRGNMTDVMIVDSIVSVLGTLASHGCVENLGSFENTLRCGQPSEWRITEAGRERIRARKT